MKKIVCVFSLLLVVISLSSFKEKTNDSKDNVEVQETTSTLIPIESYVSQTTYYTYAESTGRNIELSTSAINLPLVAEVQVMPTRISYTETEAFKNIYVTKAIQEYGAEFKTTGIAEYKRIALANAATANNADLIVGATFIVSTTPDNHFSIKVVGYPAKYVNFHTATKADAELLREMEPFSQKTLYDPILNTKSAPIKTSTTENLMEK